MLRIGRGLVLALALASASPAAAGEAQALVFATGVLDEVATGSTLVFRHSRAGSFDPARLAPIAGEEVTLELTLEEGRRAARLTMATGGARRPLPPMPAGAGHPLLLVFLETVVRDMAALTGGSPFYIRNRIREALAEQDAVEKTALALGDARIVAERASFRPFVADANRGRMGAFAELELRITLAEGVPGRFARLEAASGPGANGEPYFTEAMEFLRMTGG